MWKMGIKIQEITNHVDIYEIGDLRWKRKRYGQVIGEDL